MQSIIPAITQRRRASRAGLLSLLGVVVGLPLVVGCGSLLAGTPAERPLTADLADPAYVLTVELGDSDTLAAIERKYGGSVMVWEPGQYALVGLEAVPGVGKPGHDSPIDANEREFRAGGAMASMNGTSTLWAGGASTLWAGGASTLWAGGASTLWAGGDEGEFLWMPANTATWHQIGLREGQELAPGLGYGIKVAVIDTGVDLEHPALVEALAPAEEWWDFVDNDAVPQEVGSMGRGGFGHGTNVAGIVRQIAPRATILPIRVLDADGQGEVADLAAAVDWAVRMGADVINLSLGADKHASSIDKALKRAAERGVFVFTSAGNDNERSITFPARVSDLGNPLQRARMVSVTSVDGRDVKSEFANYSGKLELSAPGELVYGPAPGDGESFYQAAWSGTSMASPMVAGAMALALGELTHADGENLADVLKTASFDLYAIEENWSYSRRAELGQGRLDVHAFLARVLGGGNW